MNSAREARQSRLKAVHAACREMGLDEETRRSVYEAATGKRSATAMTVGDLNKVLDALKSRGWKGWKRPPRRAKATRLYDGPQARKARALWLLLHQAGEVRDPSETALAAFVARTTSRQSLGDADAGAMNAVIEALKKWCSRSKRMELGGGGEYQIKDGADEAG